MKYEYVKKCFTFGKIKHIYYSKFTYYVKLTNKNIIRLNDINILDFYYTNDINALNEAFKANNLEELVSFSNSYELNE